MTSTPAGPSRDPRADLESVTWANHRWYRVLSYYFSIASGNHEMAAFVDSVLGRFATERDLSEEPNPPTPGVPAHYKLIDVGEEGDLRYRLYYNGFLMSGSAVAGEVFDHFFWHVNVESVRRTGEFVLIHAGAVATPAGSGILIPGVSGTGKSTLVAGLLREGFTYYSDEAAAIDPIDDRLHSYPKAITLKDRTVFDTYPDLSPAAASDAYVSNRWYVVPSQIRSDVFALPAKVGFVLLSRFVPHSPTRIQSVSPARGALELGRNVMNISRYGARVLPLLSRLMRGAQCYSIETGNLRDAVNTIAEITAGAPSD